MGFGYYVLGYLFTYVMSINPYRFAFLPIGFAFFTLGTMELKKYNRKFSYFIPVLGTAFIVSLCGVFFGVNNTFLTNPIVVPSAAQTIYEWLDFALRAIVMTATVFYLRVMSLEVELPKKAKWATYNVLLTVVYYVMDLLATLGISDLIPFAAFIGIIMAASNFFLLFSCYMMICPEGQEDMPRRKSRFAFINKMNDFRDRKEQETIETSKAYYDKRRQDRKNAKNKR